MLDEQAALAAIQNVPINGLIGRLEALGRLTDKSSIVFTAHLFIFLLFVMLEITPLAVKLISLRSPYDLVLSGHEHAYETIHQVKRKRANAEMHEKIEVSTAVITHRTVAAIEAEKAIIDQKLKEKLGKINDGASDWRQAFS